MSGGEGPRANGFKMPAQQQAVRKYRRDTSEVSCCLKYVIFSVNVLFWVSDFQGISCIPNYLLDVPPL